ncbi:SRPBCC family protein [Jiangella asiatica]|uniref:SRPBCC domain-containing protein n=1 Tax=Jiangella asiatica TaxID=2530372 RepID=A0A4R5CG08_9ACTN|nr:SRPBCC domain-containing protein [Jiangella asiatica]TDD99078.1 SRPBCC domain-containing protein [Jiangella asiatica]
MGHRFESGDEVTVDATPEEVWEAIATGPGIDSWFMGRTEVEAGEGGTVRMAFGGYTPEYAVTSWEPRRRLSYTSQTAPDGRFVAYEFLIEAREHASSTLRIVTSGFLPGDDWEDEFDAMTKGNAMFFRTLAEYLTHFAGSTATPVTAFGPLVPDWDAAWAALHAELGLPPRAPVTTGDGVRVRLGDAERAGTVYFVNADTLGVRTDDALFRFLKGFRGPMIASHHVFADDGGRHTDAAWQAWLTRVLS